MSSDVIVQNFRPGVAERMGVGYETLVAKKPDLVYVSVSGYGADGPYAQAPASDSVMQADTGLMFANQDADQEPCGEQHVRHREDRCPRDPDARHPDHRAASEIGRDACFLAGVRNVQVEGRLDGPNRIMVANGRGKNATDFDRIEADTLLISVGSSPRILDSALPDGERILTWTQLYTLESIPEHLIVVGSGVTGAEFASAYRALELDVPTAWLGELAIGILALCSLGYLWLRDGEVDRRWQTRAEMHHRWADLRRILVRMVHEEAWPMRPNPRICTSCPYLNRECFPYHASGDPTGVDVSEHGR